MAKKISELATNEEVWLRAYLARIGTRYGALSFAACEVADNCLAAFRCRFPVGGEGVEPDPVE